MAIPFHMPPANSHLFAEYRKSLETQMLRSFGVPKELLQNRGVPTVLTPEQKRTRRGFLRDIRANPDDDTPRLIFADWLEDNGDPNHATLIRVQCERAAKGLTECVNRTSWPLVFACEGADWTRRWNARRCEYCRLTAEQDRVFWVWKTLYLKVEWYQQTHIGSWERGFMSSVDIEGFDFWHKWGPRICQEHPVERVELAGVERYIWDARQVPRASPWATQLGEMPIWFQDHYARVDVPMRRTQDEAVAHINHVLLSWAQCEAAKLDAVEDAKENATET